MEQEQSKNNQIKKSTNVLFNVILAVLSLFCVIPFIFVIIISFTDENALAMNGYRFIPEKLSLYAYQYIVTAGENIIKSYGVTILVTLLGTVIGLLLTGTYAYALSRKTYAYKKFFTMVITIPMLFSGGMIANYLIVTKVMMLKDTDMYKNIDARFWEAAKVQGKTYGVPSEKEIGSMPMWVFTKEYVDKYNVPYEDIHTLEDLEPWLQVVSENEPNVVPLYLTKDYTAPTYMDKIQDPIGIEYGDDTLTVKNVFETDRMKETLKTMRKYYEAGYINKDAATASDDKAQKRFVTKGDGQPYAELIWGKDLGYEVVATPIMDTSITNASARGALTAVNAQSEHPEKAVELLNLINTDIYLRNLLNYGIEGVHWEKAEIPADEAKAAEGKPYIYDTKVKLIEGASKDYSVPYWVQGGLFNTYVLDNEPLDKWATFKEFNDASEEAPSFGFDFNLDPVSTQVAGFRNVLDEFGKSLYTGSVDPDEYLPKLMAKLEATGVQEVIDEMQKQVDEWKAAKAK